MKDFGTAPFCIGYFKYVDRRSFGADGNICPSEIGNQSEVWLTGVEFNADEGAWNIFYVSSSAGDSEMGELLKSDYQGKIWRAKLAIYGYRLSFQSSEARTLYRRLE